MTQRLILIDFDSTPTRGQNRNWRPAMTKTHKAAAVRLASLYWCDYDVTMIHDLRGNEVIQQHQAQIGVEAFKSQCLNLLDSVTLTRTPLIITKRGKAVAKLVPMPETVDLFGAMSGSVKFEGDIISPLQNEWQVTR